MKYQVKLSGHERRIIEADSEEEATRIAKEGHTFEVLDDVEVSEYHGNQEEDNE